MKINLIYFSPNGETKKVSDYYLKYFKTATVLDITGDRARSDFPRGKDLGLLVLSFPVYAEDIPGILVPFLKGLVGDYAVINVTYGRVAAGKALSRAAEILKKQGFTVIGGAEVPAAHCYLREKKNSVDLAELAKVAEKIENGDFRAAAIPRQAKHPLAGFFPSLRHRVAVGKPKIDFKKCSRCRLCVQSCPGGAISDDLMITNRRCLRCLGCVAICPEEALSTNIAPLLGKYLRRRYDGNRQIKIYV